MDGRGRAWFRPKIKALCKDLIAPLAAQDGELDHNAMQTCEIRVRAAGRHSGKLVMQNVPDVNVNKKHGWRVIGTTGVFVEFLFFSLW